VQSDYELQQHLQGRFALIGGKGSASLLRAVALCGAVTEWVTGSWAAYLIPALSWATRALSRLIPRRVSEGSPKGPKTGEQKFRSLRALDILVQAPIRAPCSIIATPRARPLG
jgi:hypothetical protein